MRSAFGYKRSSSTCRTTSDGGLTVFLFKYMKIRRGGPSGVCQFEMAARGRKAVPHLFFTCPKCGEINRFYISFKMLQWQVENYRTIRSCHNCLFCRSVLPFGIDLPRDEVLKKYMKVAKQAAV